MSNNRRDCIFTDKPATKKITVVSPDFEKHNWAKSVPCAQEFIDSKEKDYLNEDEFRLVELFYQKELALLKIKRIEAEMAEIKGNKPVPEPYIPQKFDAEKVETKEVVNLSKKNNNDKIEKIVKKKKENLWG